MLTRKQYLLARWRKTYTKVLDCYIINACYQKEVERAAEIMDKKGNNRWRGVIKIFCKRWRVSDCVVKSEIKRRKK